MDDCNLDKLAIKPGKLSPKFNKSTLEYNVTLGSECEKITFDCLTSDSGASYSISNSDGGKTVALKEGQVTEIKVEVTAEDGTTKIYCVYAKRLSAKDAFLSDLKTSTGVLDPEFSPDILEYYCDVRCNASSLQVAPLVPDTKAQIQVQGKDASEALPLNIGETTVMIQVTSPDGSTSQTYTLHVIRKQIPYFIKLSDTTMAHKLECPISLSPLYRPITIRDSEPKHTFSAPVINELTKTSKVDPLNEVPLPSDWKIQDEGVDRQLSEAIGCIALPSGGYSPTCKLSELGEEVKKLPAPAPIKESEKFSTDVPFSHTYIAKSWEKQLQQIFDESDVGKLTKAADEMVQKYLDNLPLPGWKHREGDSPLEHLQNAAHCYATAIKYKPKDANLHLQLGLILEEKYYAEDMLGLKKVETVELSSLNTDAKESSKEEECAAICKLRGVGQGASLALQLKAVDEEYHHLLDSGQSGKADHVQQLYAWKSKQATQEGKAAQKVEDEESPLGQACAKYLDALSLDEPKAIYHYHLGRMLVVQGSYENAVKRLQACLGWNPALSPARFYLGLALALQKGGVGQRGKEVISCLTEGLEGLLAHNAAAALQDSTAGHKRNALLGNEMLTNYNVYLLRGIIQLGKLRLQHPDVSDCMSAQDIFHTAALLASQTKCLITRGDMYQQVEWVLLDAHSHLLDILQQQQGNTALIADRCNKLSALIRCSIIPNNADLMNLQRQTCRRLVEIQPCNSHSLYLLGSNQLAEYDNHPDSPAAAAVLQDAKMSFQASISLEGKPVMGAPTDSLTGQSWWQEKVNAEEERKKTQAAGSSNKGAPATRGGPAARGRGATRAPADKAAEAKSAAPARGGGAAGRGGATRGGASARGKAAPAPANKNQASKPAGKGVASRSSGHVCEPTAKKQTDDKSAAPDASEKPEVSTTAVPAGAPLNKKTYHPRLGLARALSRSPDGLEDAKKYYYQVIELAPEVHDAYIESADMLMKSDPLAAIDILSKFPVSENPTFDDAYIFGEIVRVLMKFEKFDDPRLAPNMIALGKVLGLGALDKYVAILDAKLKTDLLKTVYAGVNGKSVDNPDMQAFFKFKFWV